MVEHSKLAIMVRILSVVSENREGVPLYAESMITPWEESDITSSGAIPKALILYFLVGR